MEDGRLKIDGLKIDGVNWRWKMEDGRLKVEEGKLKIED